MALDLSSLKKAVNALKDSYASNQNNKSLSEKDLETLKSGVIKNFEMTYELCWKFMKHWLEQNAGSEVMDAQTMKELFRIAAEHRLIKDVEIWFTYQKARNKTSHIYDEKTAEAVYEDAVRFAADARELLKTLEAKND